MDLSLVSTDLMLAELETRATSGIVYLAKTELVEGSETHRFKVRNWGSPLLRAGMIRIMEKDNDSFLEQTDEMDTESW